MRYANNEAALAGLAQANQVHRDAYLDEEVFQLEMERLFSRAWLYVGHESQVPNAGDYISVTLAQSPVIMLRHGDGSVRVVMNRCAHKGARLVSESSGNVGKMLRCPYHAWTYRLDGSLLAVPLKNAYENTGFAQCPAAKGLSTPGAVDSYRGFVFARLSEQGPSLKEYFGDVLQALDNMADRSPQGELQVAGGSIRTVIHCNWKMYLENINDTVHPISTHESASSSAAKVGEVFKDEDPTALEQLLPFGSGYDFYSRMGVQTFPNGHSILGTKFSIHTDYSGIPGYEAMMREAWGEEKAARVLGFNPQNVVFYPSMAAKGSPQIIRVLRPLAVDRTLLEVWVFQPKGAPREMLDRGLTYSRLVYSPMSVVAHDDVHLFESQQASLKAQGNPWVNLLRQYDEQELAQEGGAFDDANNERVIRNQYRAWQQGMARQEQE
ncbi:MAG: aromatic ring-hydroxylating dioxygenase subunit alpha [Alcaligenes sp.]